MKKFLLGGATLVAMFVGPAMAADMPVKAKVAPPLICPSCNWTGFYIGGNIGGSIGVIQNTDGLSGFPTGAGFPAAGNPYLSSNVKRALPGGIGGGQVGYNWQSGSLVLGVEADWQFSREKSTLNVLGQNIAAALFTSGYSDEEKIKSFATARARLGWAHDSYLWYVTGGGAWAQIGSNYTLTSSIPATTFASPVSAGFSTNKTGWTIGGGVETCLWDGNWSAKLEYLYLDLGSVANTFTTPTTAAGTFAVFNSNNKIQDHIIRVGLNYRFGGR